MPVLNRLRKQGAWATMRSRPPPFPPCYTVLMSGAAGYQRRPAVEPASEPIPPGHRIICSARRSAPDWNAVSHTSVRKFHSRRGGQRRLFHDWDDQHATPGCGCSLALAERWRIPACLDPHRPGGLRRAPRGRTGRPALERSGRRADGLLGEILATLDLSRDTLLVCSDHGHIDQAAWRSESVC